LLRINFLQVSSLVKITPQDFVANKTF